MRNRQLPKYRSAAGFTLIELVVSMGLATMLLLTVSAMFMTFLVSGAKTNLKKAVISEGGRVLNQMEFMLRNSLQLVPTTAGSTCTTNMDSIAFQSQDGWITQFQTVNGKIASRSAHPSDPTVFTDYYLMSDTVELSQPLEFDCNTDSTSAFVTVNFSMQKTNTDSDISEEDFATTIQLRNYD